MNWLPIHIFEVIIVLVIGLIVTWRFPWKQRLVGFTVFAALLTIPLSIIWHGGGVLPPKVPFLAPAPEEAMRCSITYTFNITQWKADDLKKEYCTLKVFEDAGALISRRGD
jgi:4-amino-4-deoxy-L-arabinose transferase-like glycosyltransferase